jgi:hypothetical protein
MVGCVPWAALTIGEDSLPLGVEAARPRRSQSVQATQEADGSDLPTPAERRQICFRQS